MDKPHYSSGSTFRCEVSQLFDSFLVDLRTLTAHYRLLLRRHHGCSHLKEIFRMFQEVSESFSGVQFEDQTVDFIPRCYVPPLTFLKRCVDIV
jgi:hypothetical protein